MIEARRRLETIDTHDGRDPVTLELIERGDPDGPLVVMVPSAGRGADDFADLASRVATTGRRVICPEPRGIGRSGGLRSDLRLEELADDHAAVIRSVGRPAVVVGHAFGNRVVRLLATRHPDLVSGVVLLACGGMVPMPTEIVKPFAEVFDHRLHPDEHRQAVRTAFFAEGNDASVWDDGWYATVARAQGHASGLASSEGWASAGDRAPVLVLQPAEDAIAPPRNAELLVELIGERAEMAIIDRAGHALLPEQPERVADLVIDWLDRHVPG